MRLLVLLTAFFPLLVSAQQELSWQVQHPKTKKWIAFGTHGSVQEMLIRTGELPDPFDGENEKKFGWIERYAWIFRTDFTLSAQDLSKEFVELEMPNVDTYAKIYFNGKYVGFTENTYVVYRFDVKKLAKPGRNEIRLEFESPVAYQKKHMAEVGTVLPSPNDLDQVSAAPYCRKPQYQFGWDWALRITTIGMWKPARIVAYDVNRVTGHNISFSTVDREKAAGTLSLFMQQATAGKLILRSSNFGEQIVEAKDNVVTAKARVNDPVLWWPKGHGDQHLYKESWQLLSESGQLIDSGSFFFGVRTSQLVQEEDKWGTSYVIRINGKDIFCKGANYVPQDIFPARVTDENVAAYIRTMAESNINMVRVWGGGYYPNDRFYEECDRLGIMVWQDFMFACAMYPGNDAFLKVIKPEFDQQIPRISAHPSVVLFNGNNEVDVAWKNWGFVKQYNLSEENCRLIGEYYDRVFKQLLPERISAFTNTPYIHTSPLSNWGKAEYFDHGTQHYWGVWHGQDPIEDFGRKVGRFNSEYGFQSFPEFSTLLTFSDTSQWALDSPVMKQHQKSYVGNGMIAKHADLLYGKTSDFRRFVYNSQLTQSLAVSMAIAGHRTDMPRCAGTVFWQLNDCWPASSWSSIDYFGNWKALQYAVRDDYRDVAILAKIDTIGKERYFLVSDLYEGFPCTITATVSDLDGNPADTFTCRLAVINRTVMPVFGKELGQMKLENYLIDFTWNDNSGKRLTRSFTHIGKPYLPAQKGEISLRLVSNDLQSGAALYSVENTKFVRNLWIFGKATGLRFDRNFIDLLPGTHEVKISYEKPSDLEGLEMIWQ
jgi:beta-mannosidase